MGYVLYDQGDEWYYYDEEGEVDMKRYQLYDELSWTYTVFYKLDAAERYCERFAPWGIICEIVWDENGQIFRNLHSKPYPVKQ